VREKREKMKPSPLHPPMKPADRERQEEKSEARVQLQYKTCESAEKDERTSHLQQNVMASREPEAEREQCRRR